MKKEEFFKILNKRLSVIEQKELDDILEEYHQHIEMKMASGFSEEDAIKDFGDIDSLINDILEAYHVRIDYNDKKEAINEAVKATGDTAKNIFSKICTCVKNGFVSIGKFFKRQGNAFISIFHKKDGETEKGEGLFSFIKTLAKEILRVTVEIIKWCTETLYKFIVLAIKIFINLSIICLGSASGIVAALSIALFGITLILLLNGYPLTGIALISLGGFISAFAFGALMFSFIIINNSDNAEVATNEE